ncbi:DNA-binding protein [Bacteroides sp. 214]|uniref:HU family DNA-binding protein n=1 Tax=Bacteroides sp. 214 TaxID=2302935 RepID=UPI0013D388BC|nr:HU family DNA-binding protein [Bacteroides sp. 214]NDW12624.1 DNA-binding protein [Bacteroides sp. 214]
MSVPYKKVARENPQNRALPPKYYPRLMTLGQRVDLDSIAHSMEKASSLTLGDIQSVLTNFVSAMRTALYNGHAVNIKDFGIFKLSARTTGAEEKKDCGVENIKSVRINFLASATVKPNLGATRVGDKIDFYDAEAAILGKASADGEGGSTDPDNGGGDDNGGFTDPTT